MCLMLFPLGCASNWAGFGFIHHISHPHNQKDKIWCASLDAKHLFSCSKTNGYCLQVGISGIEILAKSLPKKNKAVGCCWRMKVKDWWEIFEGISHRKHQLLGFLITTIRLRSNPSDSYERDLFYWHCRISWLPNSQSNSKDDLLTMFFVQCTGPLFTEGTQRPDKVRWEAREASLTGKRQS